MKPPRIALILPLVVAGCAGQPPAPPATAPLSVAAASDLQSVMPRLIERFEAAQGVKVEATYGASGQFVQQIRQGAPFDLVFSANRKYIEDLAYSRSVRPNTVLVYARGSLVLVVREQVPDSVKTLADLNAPGIKKVAIANPDTAPYGAAARQAMEASGLWEPLEPKRVQAETVRQALQFVQTGNAEAAIVGKAIANVPGVRSYPIDESLYEPLLQACAVPTRSKNVQAALAFQQFVINGEGKDILREAGFSVDFPR